jgi:hypothetical protein
VRFRLTRSPARAAGAGIEGFVRAAGLEVPRHLRAKTSKARLTAPSSTRPRSESQRPLRIARDVRRLVAVTLVAMNFERMLRLCREGQWSVGDLDFSQPPRSMSIEDEASVVQYFTDMVQIERLAGALFVEQERRATDPVLREIFATFVVDELRHSHVAQMLADHYDVRRLQVYRPSRSLEHFFPAFVGAIRHLSDDVANAYITSGELFLDIALLRSIDDFVADPLSSQAMELINRDESRHIAVDYSMVEYYSSPEYRARKRALPRKSVVDQVAGARAFAAMTRWGRPFFRDVFFVPMMRVDPSGARMREAFKRMQLLGTKPGVGELPLTRFWNAMMKLHNHPRAGRRLKEILATLAGAEPEAMQRLATHDELATAASMSFDQLADEALAAKSYS